MPKKRLFTKDGIYGLLIANIVLMTFIIIFIITTYHISTLKTVKPPLIETLNEIASIMSSIATVIGVCIALTAYESWKKQRLSDHKISIILNAKQALIAFKIATNEWRKLAYTFFYQKNFLVKNENDLNVLKKYLDTHESKLIETEDNVQSSLLQLYGLNHNDTPWTFHINQLKELRYDYTDFITQNFDEAKKFGSIEKLFELQNSKPSQDALLEEITGELNKKLDQWIDNT